MKLIVTMMFSFALLTSANAQIEVTANSLKSWVGVTQIHEIDSTGTITVDVGSAGPNQTWDLSGLLTSGYQVSQTMVTAESTPYADSYPEANYAFEIQETNNPEMGTIYSYFDLQQDGFTSIGNVVVVDEEIVREFGVDDTFELPIAYNDTWEYTSIDTFSLAGLGMTITTDQQTVTADGWGTITTPSGTYECLRLRYDVSTEQKTIVSGYEIPAGSYSYIDYVWIGRNSLLLANVTSLDNESDPNFSVATSATWLSDVRGASNVAADNVLPQRFSLEQNYPNPFNPQTEIKFQLSEPQQVTLTVFDVNGRQIAELMNAVRPAGEHRVQWRGRNEAGLAVPSGIYLYRLQTESGTLSRKMSLVR